MTTRLPQRPCLAVPFTILGGPDRVRLVSGEDFRYTLEGAALEQWLPQWLPLLDGRRSLQDALASLPEVRRDAAREIVEHLYGERVLIDGPISAAHRAGAYRSLVEGEGLLYRELTTACQQFSESAARPLPILCQDRLDYDEALSFNRRCLEGDSPWLWASCAAMSRGYVGPLILPDAGPCLECLFSHFQRRSPLPELYDELIDHARQGGSIEPTPLPARPLTLLAHLTLGKVEMASVEPSPAALFRLHVLDAATLEVTTHRVFLDPECRACAGKR